MVPLPEEPALEERLHELVHLCEALRAVCAEGPRRGLTLADAEPLALLAALLAAELRAAVLGAPPYLQPPDGQAR